jgi:hypothetical protein
VITTSLDAKAADCVQVLRYYRSLQNLEHRFRIAEDFLALRPVFHWTEEHDAEEGPRRAGRGPPRARERR